MEERKSVRAEKGRWIQVLLLLFVFGGVFGFIYEELFYRIDLGYFVKRGTTYGPWIPIYGFGAVLIMLATEHIRKKPVLVFLMAGLVSGVLEFATGYILHHVSGVRLWDYNTEIWNWLNIGGYVCLRSVLFFAVSGIMLRYLVYPLVRKFAESCSRRKIRIIAGSLTVLCLGDMLISFLAKRCIGR